MLKYNKNCYVKIVKIQIIFCLCTEWVKEMKMEIRRILRAKLLRHWGYTALFPLFHRKHMKGRFASEINDQCVMDSVLECAET